MAMRCFVKVAIPGVALSIEHAIERVFLSAQEVACVAHVDIVHHLGVNGSGTIVHHIAQVPPVVDGPHFIWVVFGIGHFHILHQGIRVSSVPNARHSRQHVKTGTGAKVR